VLTGLNLALQVPAANGHQCFIEISAGCGNNVLVDDYAVDAANANDGFDVFLSVT
jgi:hypothetical protein